MVYLVIGRREQGKTTLAYWMASRSPRRLIFDPRGMVGRERYTNTSALEGACDRLAAGEIAEVVYTPFGDVHAGFAAFAGEVQRWVLHTPGMPLAVVVDEVSFVHPERVPAFMWAVRCCRRDTIDFLVTAHRPSDIDTDIRAVTDPWCLFAIRQEHDLGVIRERCTADVLRRVQALEPRQFIQWDDAKGEARMFADPAVWFIELSPPHAPAPGSATLQRLGPQVEGLDDLPSAPIADPTAPRLF
jgi:hypothetical protein